MRIVYRAMLILSFLVWCLPAANGQPVTAPASFTAFNIAVTEELPDSDHEPVPLVLLSDAGGKTVFSVPGLDALNAVSGGSFGSNDQYWLVLGIAPRPGYALTSYQLCGTVTGRFEIGTAPPDARNVRQGGGDSDAYFGIGWPWSGDVRIADLQGVQTFDFTAPGPGGVPGLPWQEMLVWGLIHSNAISTYYDFMDESGSWEPRKSPSAVFLSVSDTRLTLHWELVPVPEPAAWLMLAVGLLPFSLGLFQGRHAPRRS